MDVLTRHTHTVSRKLHRHPSSVHLTSTVCWLKKERKKDWQRASFTGQSRHWSVSFFGGNKPTNKFQNITLENGCLKCTSSRFPCLLVMEKKLMLRLRDTFVVSQNDKRIQNVDFLADVPWLIATDRHQRGRAARRQGRLLPGLHDRPPRQHVQRRPGLPAGVHTQGRATVWTKTPTNCVLILSVIHLLVCPNRVGCCSWLLDWTWCTTIRALPRPPASPGPHRPSPRSRRLPSPPTSRISAPSLTLTIASCHSPPRRTRTSCLRAG